MFFNVPSVASPFDWLRTGISRHFLLERNAPRDIPLQYGMSEHDYYPSRGDYYAPQDAHYQRRLSWWVWLILIALVAIFAGVGYYFWKQQSEPPTFTLPEPPAAAPPAPKAEKPEIRHPVPPSKSEPEVSLPPLERSDAYVGELLAELMGHETFRSLLIPDQLVRRIVATVDHLPRKVVPTRANALRPVRGPFTPDIANRSRYNAHVKVFEALDARALVQAYVKLYPLFQGAYANLGFPDGYFNDRLVAAIDDMLSAPELTTQPELVQPKVFYRYSDPDLEGRSAGQKILMRLGAENAAKVKAKLREIRGELTTTEPAAR